MDRFEHLNTASFLTELQGGSSESFEQLARDIFPALWRYLIFMAHVREADAEDITQETLIKVHANVKSFRPDGEAKLTTWIFQVAHNLAMDYHRASNRPQHTLDKSEFPTGSRLQFACLNFMALRRLRNGLEMLSGQDQQLLKWRACDVPFGEIARWLSIKENTARVRHLRATRQLTAICDRMERDKEFEGSEDVLV